MSTAGQYHHEENKKMVEYFNKTEKKLWTYLKMV